MKTYLTEEVFLNFRLYDLCDLETQWLSKQVTVWEDDHSGETRNLQQGKTVCQHVRNGGNQSTNKDSSQNIYEKYRMNFHLHILDKACCLLLKTEAFIPRELYSLEFRACTLESAHVDLDLAAWLIGCMGKLLNQVLVSPSIKCR